MVDTVRDIEVLQRALIALTEGASDEKRAAIEGLRKMLKEKMESVEQFEKQMENA